jgi:hypothetical protein
MSTHSPAADLAQRLAQNVEAVCRTYLSNGRRAGGYWVVGDAENHPGSSLFVRLQGPDSGKGAAGKWSDAATGDHGDLLDLIARNRHLDRLRDVLDEARSFLSLPRPVPDPTLAQRRVSVPQGSCESARRLFAASRPLAGTLAERYLQGRSLTDVAALPALRFHPRCFYRPEEGAKNLSFPALVAAVTDLCGTVTGVHRTWLDPAGAGKAAVEDFPTCPWPQLCHRTTSPPSCSHRDCASSTSCATATRPATWRWKACPPERRPPASWRWR